jgi:hypothetical protein
MKTLRALLLTALAVTALLGAPPAADILRPPAGPDVVGARATVSATGGRIVLSWIEQLGPQAYGLYTAQLAPDATAWSPATAIAAGADLVATALDAPQVVVGTERRALAVWLRDTLEGTQGWTASSLDEGLTWGPPQRLTAATSRQEFVSIIALPEGRFLAAWLDSRTGQETALYARLVGEPGPDMLVDDRVCDCCALALTAFPDGSLALVYRDRTADEIRDLALAGWSLETGWKQLPGTPADGWQINGCPVSGPAIARVGARLGLAWFTASENDARIMVSTSNTGGLTWSLGNRLSASSTPVGRVNTALLRNGSLWTSWLEPGGIIALRELKPGGRPGETIRRTAAAVGVPQLVVARDVPGKPGQLMLIYETKPSDEAAARLVTLRFTLPEPTVTLSDDCGCDPTAAVVGSHPIRAEVLTIDRASERVTIRHTAVPGIMPATERTVRLDVRLLDVLEPGQSLFARIERRDDGDWWLFDIRIARRP